MFSKSKSWMTGGVWKPKNPHSLEHLKYLYGMLCKNQTVTEQNHGLLVETLRSISEILIWGDQNDSSVFDFFLEKNMLAFFLRFMRQKSGRHICVQLLQTLNILFENISNETSVYYLLSNNHINSIIVHKFDFSDEEVMAYYISFLKTLSLKLNKHTIHFFYNEHTNDFALYTEAIKFFNHSESMVRIAVRTITLNVYRACRFTSVLDDQGQPIVDEKSMLRYIRDKTAAPYFSNLVWFIGSHVLELDACVCGDINHNSRGRLSDLVAEHLDHLHYLNDILSLNIQALNEVLTEHLINRLLVPLYVCSLDRESQLDRDSVASSSAADDQPFISPVVSLFLLSQVFLIIHYEPLVRGLAEIVFSGKIDISPVPLDSRSQISTKLCGFIKPLEPLAETLENACRASDRSELSNYDDIRDEDLDDEEGQEANEEPGDEKTDPNEELSIEPEVLEQTTTEEVSEVVSSELNEEVATTGGDLPDDIIKPLEELNTNSTDEEKLRLNVAAAAAMAAANWRTSAAAEFDLADRPYLSSLFSTLDCSESDYKALFALCLLYALTHNYGINQDLLDSVFMPTDASQTKHHYNMALVQLLIRILSNSAQSGSKVRLVTLELAILMLKTLVYKAGERSFLQDAHLAAIEGAREEATLQMRNFYKVWEKSEEIFLDMFEDEYRETMSRPLNVEYLTMDASILLPPTGTPLTGIEFNRRLPCGEVERAKRAIRMFFLIRNLSFTLRQEVETQLPLTRQEECVKVDDVLDLNNSDLIACTVIAKDSNKKDRRFLVIDILQLILVEPDSKRLGWGVVRFVGFLQDVEVSGDKDDSRCLHVTVLRPTSITGGPAASTRPPPKPLLSSRFVFDDHIRCMAARQRLVKGRLRARQRKMQMIAKLLELPAEASSSSHRPHSGLHTVVSNFQKANPNPLMMATTVAHATSSAIPGRSHMVSRKQTSDQTAPKDSSSSAAAASSSSSASSDVQHSVFASVTQVAAFNTAVARDQEQEAQTTRRAPRLVQQRTASTGTSSTAAAVKPSAAAKKKLLSMALQAQKQRQEAALAAGVISGGRNSPLCIGSESSGTKHASAGEANPETASSSDTDSSPQRRQRRSHKKSTLHSDSKATDGVDGPPQPLDNNAGELESREASLQTSAVRRTRTGSGGNFPKSLIPADSETVSLLPLVCDIDIRSTDGSKANIMLDSPVKLMPPADPELILKLSSLNTPVSDGRDVDVEAEPVCSEYADENAERVDATRIELQTDNRQRIAVPAVYSERGNDCDSVPTGEESLEEVEADGEDRG